MKKYAPQKLEPGPRDIVARTIATEIREGRGFHDESGMGYVHLDAPSAPRKLRKGFQTSAKYG